MKKYQHIYFDLDRTLWDFDKNSVLAFKEIFSKYNLNNIFPDFNSFVCTYQKHNDDLWALYREGKIKKAKLRNERFLLTLEDFGIKDEKLAEKIGDEYVTISPMQTVLFPNVHEILTYLKAKKYNLYIITNGFKEVQYVKLENSNLTQYFDKVFTSEEVGHQKPKPEIFSHAITTVNAKKVQSIMIGDDINVDIQGAKDFGIDQIFFNPDRIDVNILPSFEIQDLIEIKNIL